MEIVNIRIEERLIHGQVATVWTQALKPNRIIVVDRDTSQNDLQKKVMRLACPQGVKLSIFSPKRAVERLAEGLRSLGHQVTVFAPEGAGWEEEPDVVRFRVLYEWRDKGLVIGNFSDSRIEKRFREEQFDVIHVHHPVVIGFTAVYLSKKYGNPLGYTYHTPYEVCLVYF